MIGKWVSNPSSAGTCFGLVGPPGVGKTLLAKSISKALDIPFGQITLGGQNDGELLHGHGYTYSGSQPGMIIKKMVEMGKSRCILYFDELDKACSKHGTTNEITSILIHLTDPNMNRLMFSQKDSAELIKNTIDVCEDTTGGFVCLKKMKSINMLDLANILSNEVHVVGSRPGEKLNEDLISDSEVDYTYLEGDYVYLRNDKNSGTNKLTSSYSSKTAERMNEQEIKDLIWNHS